jgi:drug/metabolite transporter (DMT)-like permease
LGANPVFAGLLAGWLGWDQFKRKNWFGVIVCLVGLALLTGIGSTTFSPMVLLGDGIALMSAFFGACYTVLSKRFLGDYSPLQILTFGLLFSSIPVLLFAGDSLRAQDWSTISFEVYAILAFAAILGTVVATIFWLKSVTRIGILRTSLYQYLLPVVGLILALVLLKEQLDVTQWVGIAIVFVGTYFARSS